MLPSGLYPIRGLLYFIYHPTLCKSCIDLVVRLLLISVAALVVLSFTTYHIQFLALSRVFGDGLLGRCAVLVALLAEAIIPVYALSEQFTCAVRNRLFDTVLKQQGISHLSPLTTKEKTNLRTRNAEDKRWEQKAGNGVSCGQSANMLHPHSYSPRQQSHPSGSMCASHVLSLSPA